MKKLLLFLGLLLACAIPASAGWSTPVQSNSQTGAGSSITYTSNVTSGDQMIACAKSSTASDTLGFSSSPSATWTDTGNGNVSSSGGGWTIGCSCATAGSTASTSVTVSASASLNIAISEFSGGSCTVDGHNNTANGTSGTGSNNATSGNFTPVTNGDLVIGWGYNNVSAFTIGTNVAFASVQAPQSFNVLEYFIQTTAAQLAADFTMTNSSSTYSIIGFALTPAGSGTSGGGGFGGKAGIGGKGGFGYWHPIWKRKHDLL
jgi:hypothetical protein